MFPATYFPSSYWPPSLFPTGRGILPPGAVKILIGGVDMTDFLTYRVATSFGQIRMNRGTCALPLVLSPEDAVFPAIDQNIEIFNPSDTRVWYGTVNDLKINFIGDDGWRVITVGGTTFEQQVDTAQLEKYKVTNQSASVAVTALITEAKSKGFMPGVGLGTISGSTVIKDLEVTRVADGLNALASMAGCIWYVDSQDGNLYFHPPGDRAVSFSLASEDILWETAEWTQTRDNYTDQQWTQYPDVAVTSTVEEFTTDGAQFDFVLLTAPEYLISVEITPIGLGERVASWTPGSDTVRILPPPPKAPDGTPDFKVVVRYMGSAQHKEGSGKISRRYTLTKTFTQDGAIQEAIAALARYSLKPSQLVFKTDKPGIFVGRALTIAIVHPIEAPALLNGTWYVVEVGAEVVPGLEQLSQADYPDDFPPVGNFRYTVRLVNSASVAVFQGDGATTAFALPTTPASLDGGAVTPNPLGVAYAFSLAGDTVTVTPAPPDGSGVLLPYTAPDATTDLPTFVDFWSQLAGVGEVTPKALADEPVPTTLIPAPPAVYIRTLTLYDLTVGNNIAPQPAVYHDGVGLRVVAVLRKDITADLTVRINKLVRPDETATDPIDLITFTLSAGTPISTAIEFSLAAGSPALLPTFLDRQVLTADILESDGQKDKNGVASITVEWEAV